MNLQAVIDRIRLMDRAYRAMLDAEDFARRHPTDPALVRRALYYQRRYQRLVDAYDPKALGLDGDVA